MEFQTYLLYLLGGAAGGLLTVGVVVLVLSRRARKAQAERPPKGTRPRVRTEIDGVLYDLTDDLVLAGENPIGFALWLVVGPPHLTMQEPPTLLVAEPLPTHTEIRVSMRGERNALRFATLEETQADIDLRADHDG